MDVRRLMWQEFQRNVLVHSILSSDLLVRQECSSGVLNMYIDQRNLNTLETAVSIIRRKMQIIITPCTPSRSIGRCEEFLPARCDCHASAGIIDMSRHRNSNKKRTIESLSIDGCKCRDSDWSHFARREIQTLNYTVLIWQFSIALVCRVYGTLKLLDCFDKVILSTHWRHQYVALNLHLVMESYACQRHYPCMMSFLCGRYVI